MKTKQKLIGRLRTTKKWKKYFKEKYKRDPTNEEIQSFGIGFNSGYNKCNKRKK